MPTVWQKSPQNARKHGLCAHYQHITQTNTEHSTTARRLQHS
nr:MAG TPA: hypothetical protein [Caudoviricetes sp.]